MDERFERILDESMKLFLKYGIRNMSMDDICRELGISKKTLYQYAENKADLIHKGLQKILDQSRLTLEKSPERSGNAIEQLLDHSRCAFGSMKDFDPSRIFELQKFYPEIFRYFMNEKKKLIYSSIIRNIRKGIDEGVYRNDIDTEAIATLYVQQLEILNNPDVYLSSGISFENFFKVMFDTHIRAIASTEGLNFYEQKLKQLLTSNPHN